MALLQSVPRLDRPRQARLDPVKGQPPDLTRLDQGCAFRPRCRFAVDACAHVRPPLEPAGPAGHLAACLRCAEITAAAGAVA
jgi:oligopeptide/dipeptide ABC transporter ATP-binding protein